MSFAVVAHALVARQANAEIGTESNFNMLSIVGISLGGAAFLIVLSVGAIHFWYTQRKRRMNLERNTFANRSSNYNSNQQIGVVIPRASSTNSLRMRYSPDSPWGQLPSQEDLQADVHITRRRSKKRSSFEILSWPLPRRTSSRTANQSKKVRDSQLSAILESPNCHRKIPQSQSRTEASLPIELEAISPSVDPTTKGSSHHLSPSGITQPAPLFNNARWGKMTSEITNPWLSRSISGPSVLINAPGHAVIRNSPRNLRRETHLKFLSMGKSLAAPPTGPLPPLPDLLDDQRDVESGVQERLPSGISESSLDSLDTAILNSPNISASIDFSQRHPEMNLGVQIRQNQSDFKQILMSGPRQSRVRSKISKTPWLKSSVASLRITSARNSIEFKRLSLGDTNIAAMQSRRLSVGSPRTAPMTAPSRTSSRTSEKDSVARVVTTPKRDTQTHRLSDVFGSPIERRRSSGLKSVLGSNSMSSRAISQTSMQTASTASPADPFQWDTPSITKNPTSLKSSPVSKKTHKRQSSIRGSNALAYQHPPSRSEMRQIAEEPSFSKSFEVSSPSIEQSPTLGMLAPQLSNPTLYRAALASGSERLSSAQSEQDRDNDDRLSKDRLHVRDTSPTRAGSPPNSSASSVFIPTFPAPGIGRANDKSVSEQQQRERNSIITESISSPFSSSPRQYIPGLSLLQQNEKSMRELQFPTIRLMSSPPEREDHRPDSPEILCPSSPRLAKAQLPSSPPIPRSLSPPLKSSPTTQVCQPKPPIPTQRITPLSSVINPMNTKPHFLLPIEVPHHLHPSWRPAIVASDMLQTAKMLRRSNTEPEMGESREARRYLHVGRESSSTANRADIKFLMSSFEENPPGGDQKENDGYWRDSMSWDDGDDFWNTSSADAKNNQALLETPVSKPVVTKTVSWGPVVEREKTPRASFGEDDFF